MARILIVEDSPTEMFKLVEMVRAMGHEALQAETGEKGLELAFAELPDLILMDVVMPGLNGFQATRKLTKDPATAHIPIVIVTTKDQETDKVWGMRQGAKDYCVKPVVPSVLKTAFDKLL